MSDSEQKIKEMAKLVVASNRISSAHEKNMKMWPLIMFWGVSSVKIDYDLSYKHDVDVGNKNDLTVKAPIRNSFVAYYLTIEENVQNTHMDKRFKQLEDSTRSLFWKDLSVEIYFNNVIKYKSVRNG